MKTKRQIIEEIGEVLGEGLCAFLEVENQDSACKLMGHAITKAAVLMWMLEEESK